MTDELAMAAGVIPVRQAALPGVVKLPRRYEKAALGDPRTARHRKISFCSARKSPTDSMPARLDDLMTAIMWVKQELILLRQHDILLKRQFFDIHHSIRSMHIRKHQKSPFLSPSSSSSFLSPTSSLSPGYQDYSYLMSPRSTPASSPTEVRVQRSASPTGSRQRSSSGRLPSSLSDYCVGPALVRPSASAMVLNNNDRDRDDDGDDTDGDDAFDEEFFRPRTSSMRTSRDLAALARRRGSKELI